jgi:hypothetical protein
MPLLRWHLMVRYLRAASKVLAALLVEPEVRLLLVSALLNILVVMAATLAQLTDRVAVRVGLLRQTLATAITVEALAMLLALGVAAVVVLAGLVVRLRQLPRLLVVMVV